MLALNNELIMPSAPRFTHALQVQIFSFVGVPKVRFKYAVADERVRTESGPFDHPAILLVNGYTGTAPELEEQIFAIEATGANHSIRAKQFPHAYEH